MTAIPEQDKQRIAKLRHLRHCRGQNAMPALMRGHMSESNALMDQMHGEPVPPVNAGLAEAHLEDVLAAPGAAGLAALVTGHAAIRRLLLGIMGASPFLTGLIRRDPAFAASCMQQAPVHRLNTILDDMDRQVAAATGQDDVMACLRRAKAQGGLLVALADIAGVWDTLTAAEHFSMLAERLAQAAVRWLLAEQARAGNLVLPDPQAPDHACGYTVLAMGKLGAAELNYSSDIDLIVLYDAEAAPVAPGKDAARIFIRLTRALVKLLQERTGQGYVFRTDLRLRPDPGATQVAISVDAAAQYYLVMGQNWERAAMIRARPVAGDRALGHAFLDELKPFIWRKYLDFAAIADVHAMKRQIHAHKGHGRIAVAGHNIKLGRGGIREIEFFVQTQQLIAGGRQPELRAIRTLGALAALEKAGWIEARTCEELAAAYRFLRHVEHRIQMVHDEQTHCLPKDAGALAQLAAFAGFADTNRFSARLLHHLGVVQKHYSALFEHARELASGGDLVFTGGEDDPATLQTLSDLGFANAAEVSRTIRGWHAGRYMAMRSQKARERLTEIMPVLLRTLSRTADPMAAFNAFDRFLSRLPAGVQLFSLLTAQPDLMRLLADIMGTAPRLAGLLSYRPRTLEAVLDADFFTHLPNLDDYRAGLAAVIGREESYEDRLDAVHGFGLEHKFRIGVRLLAGTISAGEAGQAYADLAAATISALLKEVTALFACRHGRIKDSCVAVVAMGKLGSGEMAATSDLDLMLIYTAGEEPAASDGKVPLMPGTYYSRLTQRLIGALTAPTTEGALYEVDMRLRPSGKAGPLATSLEAFAAYQAESAWIWEKMALTRARPVAGPAALQQRIATLIEADLRQRRDPDALIRGAADMRNRIAAHKGGTSPWDIKLVRGGMVDLEFIVQVLQLVHAHEHPAILQRNSGRVIAALAERALLDAAECRTLTKAHHLYDAVSQILRLCVDGVFDPATAPEGLKTLVARAAGQPDMATLEAELRHCQRAVAGVFDRLIAEKMQK